MPRSLMLLIATFFFSTSSFAHTSLFSHATAASETSHLFVHILMLLPITALGTWIAFSIKRWISH